MKSHRAGFTLIELLIVITIIGLLAAALLPMVLESQQTANNAADQANLRKQFAWIRMFKEKNSGYGAVGGCKFVIQPWVKGVVPHTEENLACYFTPGIREQDAHYSEVREKMIRGENPWSNLDEIRPEDTHYAGRSKEKIRGMEDGNEVWMANDNEGGWSHPDGTINLLMGSGSVRSISYIDLQKRVPGLGELDKANPAKTFGGDAILPELKSLDN